VQCPGAVGSSPPRIAQVIRSHDVRTQEVHRFQRSGCKSERATCRVMTAATGRKQLLYLLSRSTTNGFLGESLPVQLTCRGQLESIL